MISWKVNFLDIIYSFFYNFLRHEYASSIIRGKTS